jgi:hypothetical protein
VRRRLRDGASWKRHENGQGPLVKGFKKVALFFALAGCLLRYFMFFRVFVGKDFVRMGRVVPTEFMVCRPHRFCWAI